VESSAILATVVARAPRFYHSRMLTLGIETSGPVGSVALVDAARVIGSADLALDGRRHARTLVSELKELFQRCGCTPRDCECVAVDVGPGSFTGLRVGVVCAKTFAYATGCQVVAVESLRAIAANASADIAEVSVLLDAQRGEVFEARYQRRTPGDWERLSDIQIVPLTSIAPNPHPAGRFSGPPLAKRPDLIAAGVCLPESHWSPRAEVVARLGEHAALRGATTDLWSLEPLYTRKSAAEEKWDADVARRSMIADPSANSTSAGTI
jgi:tRNA threonylcarbamoyladenosine biosynthesis protein TsaB